MVAGRMMINPKTGALNTQLFPNSLTAYGLFINTDTSTNLFIYVSQDGKIAKYGTYTTSSDVNTYTCLSYGQVDKHLIQSHFGQWMYGSIGLIELAFDKADTPVAITGVNLTYNFDRTDPEFVNAKIGSATNETKFTRVPEPYVSKWEAASNQWMFTEKVSGQ
jgi:hypothetical protein